MQLTAGEPILPAAGGGPGRLPLARLAARGTLPLSFAQQRLWLLDQLQPGNSAYHLSAVLSLEGDLAVPALAQSLAEEVRRHEALRTRFAESSGEPVQVVEERVAPDLPVVDLSWLAGDLAESAAAAPMSEVVHRPFALAGAPLLRVVLVRMAPRCHRLVLVMHHMVSDGCSMGVLVRDLSELYRAFALGLASPLPELPIQYGDFTVWQRRWLTGEVLAQHVSYWRRRLDGLPPLLELPLDRERPPVASYAAAVEAVAIGAALSQAVLQASRGQGATPCMLLLAAFATLLARWTGRDDVVMGVPVAGRTRPQLESLIGCFVNTLVIRADLAGDPRFGDALALVRHAVLEADAHQDLPFERLVEELRPERSPQHSPLFQVMLVFEVAGAWPELPALRSQLIPLPRRETPYELTLMVSQRGDRLHGSLHYNPRLWDAATMRRVAGQLVNLLAGAVTDPGRRISALPLLGAGELHQVLHEWAEGAANGGPAGEDAAGDEEALVHDLIAAQAARTPDAVAVAGPGEQVLTYGALAARSQRLASLLRARGVAAETLVAVRMRRGPGALVAILAVLEAGGAYLPLDPTYPEERLAFIAADAGVRLVLDDESQAAAGEPAATGEPAPETAGATGPLAGNAAYAIYTSGSTGQPKGVVVSHGALRRSTRARLAGYGGQVSSFLLLPPLAFDSSVAVIFWTLCQGGSLVIPEDARRSDPEHLSQLIARHGVSHWLSIPRLYDLLLAHGDPRELAPLRTVIVAGEPCSRQLVARHRALLPGAALYNEYGPTECTVWATVGGPDHAPAGAGAAIGRPIPGATVRLLDPALAPAPAGVAAELMIGGEGVARGYLGRPDLTARRFVPDPFAGSAAPPGARLYRTGDLARWLPDGRLDYLGRSDRQLKIRGYRIELGEIEAVLARHPGVREAVVVASPGAPAPPAIATAPADPILVAYVVPAGPTEAPAAQELRDLLRRALPEHMVPAGFVLLAALPSTANGKLDRRALPAFDPGQARRERQAALPQTAAERRIAAVWQEALGIDEVGVDDNFFDLGGHSLLLARVLAGLRRQPGGEQLQLVDLFRHVTVAAQARHLRQRAGGGAPPDAAETGGMDTGAGERERLLQGRRRQQAKRDLRRQVAGG